MGRSDFTLAELKQAFELRVVHMVMTADEVIEPAEMEFLELVFPPDEIDRAGFLDRTDNRFTRRFAKAIQAAPDALAQWLSEDEKLDMLRLFFKACEADGAVDPRELSVIVQAGRMLGLGQDELVPHLSKLVGARSVARPPTPSRPAPSGGASLATTQDGIHASLGTSPGPGTDPLRERLDDVLRDDDAVLTIIVTLADAQNGRTHGIDALVSFAASHGTLVTLAGRIAVAFDAWEGARAAPVDNPELRAYVRALLSAYPWLPAWLFPHDGAAGQLVACLVPVDVTDPDYATYFLALAVEAANWAVALIRRLGGTELDAVYAYLAELGMTDIPPGFFDGVEGYVAGLDARARAVG